MEKFPAWLPLCAGNSPVTGESPAQRAVTGTLMFSLICARIYGWVNNFEAGDLRRHRAHYDVTVMRISNINHAKLWAVISRPCPYFSGGLHYDDVIMTAIASQISSLTIVYWIVYSGTDKRKHQSSASLAFVRGIHRGPVNSPHKGPVTRKMFPFDDVIMVKPSLKLGRGRVITAHTNNGCDHEPQLLTKGISGHLLG